MLKNIFGDLTDYWQKYNSNTRCPLCNIFMQKWTDFWHNHWIQCPDCSLKLELSNLKENTNGETSYGESEGLDNKSKLSGITNSIYQTPFDQRNDVGSKLFGDAPITELQKSEDEIK